MRQTRSPHASSAVPRLGRSRVSAAVTAPDFGVSLTPGQVVDLDQRLPRGGVLADVVCGDWFELIEEAPAPALEDESHG